MRRNDAVQIYDIPVFNKIFPFMMKRRCDALVYHSFELDVSKTLDYIRAYNAQKPELRLKFFYVFCSALMRTIAMRPELNRFISNYRYWQRNELSLNFVVKEDFTDNAPETSSPLVFKPEMTVFDYAKIIDKYINDSRQVSEKSNFTDDVIRLITSFPTWLVAFFVKILGILDNRGRAPKFLKEADGLHTSVYISNLGSIGITGGSPHHHLYEWGTTSIFMTLGSAERKKTFNDDGSLLSCKTTVQVGVTVDERITSGFYFVKSMLYLQDLLNNPKELEKIPVLPPAPPTKREYRKILKEKNRQRLKGSAGATAN